MSLPRVRQAPAARARGFKGIVNAVCAKIAPRLPWSVQRTLLAALADEIGAANVIHAVGRRLRIQAVTVEGDNGVVSGPLWDMNAEAYGLLARYAEEGTWAAETVRAFTELFGKHDQGTFLDIGANIGLTLIPVARCQHVRCYGFEPDPWNFQYLSENIARNCPDRNVAIRHTALYDQAGTLLLGLSETNCGDHQLMQNGDRSRRTVPVPVSRLDDLLDVSTLPRPIAAKIDTQGAEPGIFAGGAAVLAEASLLSLEFSPSHMRRLHGDVDFELQFLAGHFSEGTITAGDSEARASPRPIGEIVSELRRHWEDPAIGKRYFDVVVWRS